MSDVFLNDCIFLGSLSLNLDLPYVTRLGMEQALEFPLSPLL